MNSYQRLKQENQELRQQLAMVCIAPDSDASRAIIAKVQSLYRIEVAVWFGETELKSADGSKFEGYLKYLKSPC